MDLTTLPGLLITEKIRKRGIKIRLSKEFNYPSRTQIYVVPRPPIENDEQNSVDEYDIVMSPFPPNTWKNIYSIKIVPTWAKDGPGFIAKFSKILSKKNISILKMQSNPKFSGEPYSFWLILDFSENSHLKDIDAKLKPLIDTELESISATSGLEENKYCFKARERKIQDYLNKEFSSLLKISEIRGLQFLYNFSIELAHTKPDYWNEIKQNLKRSFYVNNFEGLLPEKLLSAPNLNIGRQRIQYSVISNPNQYSYFITRIFAHGAFIYLDVHSTEEIGVIKSISETIFSFGGDILCTTATIESIEDRKCHFYALIKVKGDNLEKMLLAISEISSVVEVRVLNMSFSLKAQIKKLKIKKVTTKSYTSSIWYFLYFNIKKLKDAGFTWHSFTFQLIMAIFSYIVTLLLGGFLTFFGLMGYLKKFM